MRTVRLVGVCLVAAFALGAIAASGAQAAEYGQCLAKKHGNYSNAGCTTSKPHKGKYEWYPGPPATCLAKKKGNYANSSCTTLSKPHKGKYEKQGGPGFTSTGGLVYLEAPVLAGPIMCTGSSDSGKITSVTTDEDQLTFTGCTYEGLKCTTRGELAGTIVSDELETTLVDLGLGEVGTKFQSKSGPYGYEYTCEAAAEVRVYDWVTALDGGNVNQPSHTGTQDFALGVGEQDLEAEVDIGLGWMGPDHAYQETSVTDNYASAVEIRG
jgi:hypothetical protein